MVCRRITSSRGWRYFLGRARKSWGSCASWLGTRFRLYRVALGRAVAAFGLHYAPDPSSQAACTIGGNVAENAGGPHCLKYGVTTNHIVALEVVLPDGSIVRMGSTQGEPWGPDLVGLFV